MVQYFLDNGNRMKLGTDSVYSYFCKTIQHQPDFRILAVTKATAECFSALRKN